MSVLQQEKCDMAECGLRMNLGSTVTVNAKSFVLPLSNQLSYEKGRWVLSRWIVFAMNYVGSTARNFWCFSVWNHCEQRNI